MVDWLAAARGLASPVLAARRGVKKWGADKQALVREGSEVVTPVIQLAQGSGQRESCGETSKRSMSRSSAGRKGGMSYALSYGNMRTTTRLTR